MFSRFRTRPFTSREKRLIVLLLVAVGLAAWKYVPRPWHPSAKVETARYVILSTAAPAQTAPPRMPKMVRGHVHGASRPSAPPAARGGRPRRNGGPNRRRPPLDTPVPSPSRMSVYAATVWAATEPGASSAPRRRRKNAIRPRRAASSAAASRGGRVTDMRSRAEGGSGPSSAGTERERSAGGCNSRHTRRRAAPPPAMASAVDLVAAVRR